MKPSAPPAQRPKGARVVLPKKSSSSSSGEAVLRESMKRYEQDLAILSRKIADCQGDAAPVPGLILPVQPESLFVNNLRNSVDKGGAAASAAASESTLRLNMLERVVEKSAELDRVILKMTDAGTSTARARRKSKDGSDLHSMPTHMLLVDRLLDVFAVSQRLQIIEKQRGGGGSSTGSSSSADVEKLKQQLAEAEAAMDKYKEQVKTKDRELDAFRRDHGNAKGTDKGGDVSKLTVIGDGKAIISVEVDEHRPDEVAKLKAQLERSEQRCRDLEERMEIVTASEQSTLNGIVSMTFALSNSHDVPTPEKLSLKFLNMEAKKATDRLLTTVVDLVSSKCKGAVEQYNDMLQENKLASLEFDAFKTTTQSDLARKNAEILALQEALSKAYEENAKADSVLQEAKDSGAERRKELIQEYEQKLQDYRADHASSASLKRQLERANTSAVELEKRCVVAENKNIEMDGSLQCLKSDLAALEQINQKLMDNIKKMTNQANKNDFADTFEEVMREEMMAMKTAFEEKLRIARQQTEDMSKKRQSEISRIEGSRSTGGLR